MVKKLFYGTSRWVDTENSRAWHGTWQCKLNWIRSQDFISYCCIKLTFRWSVICPSSTVPNVFSSKTTGPIKAIFHVEPSWVGETKLRSIRRSVSHDQNSRQAHICYLNTLQNSFLQNQWADWNGTWYVAFGPKPITIVVQIKSLGGPWLIFSPRSDLVA